MHWAELGLIFEPCKTIQIDINPLNSAAFEQAIWFWCWSAQHLYCTGSGNSRSAWFSPVKYCRINIALRWIHAKEYWLVCSALVQSHHNCNKAVILDQPHLIFIFFEILYCTFLYDCDLCQCTREMPWLPEHSASKMSGNCAIWLLPPRRLLFHTACLISVSWAIIYAKWFWWCCRSRWWRLAVRQRIGRSGICGSQLVLQWLSLSSVSSLHYQIRYKTYLESEDFCGMCALLDMI